MGVSGELNWRLGDATLTSITAWRDNTLIAGNDTDYTSVDILWEPATNGNLTDFKQFSQELRLAGKNGPLNWLVGGFFSSEILTNTQTLWAGNDFDLYLGGLSSAAVGTPNFALVPELTGNAARTDLRARCGRLLRLFQGDVEELRAVFERDLFDYLEPGSHRRLSLYARKESHGLELQRHRRRLRPAASC